MNIVYHLTSFENAVKIIQTNTLLPQRRLYNDNVIYKAYNECWDEDEMRYAYFPKSLPDLNVATTYPKESISFTRDKNFIGGYGRIFVQNRNNVVVRFAFDKDKLKSRYKMFPIDVETVWKKGKSLRHQQSTSKFGNNAWNETEERLFVDEKGITNVGDYIVAIDLGYKFEFDINDFHLNEELKLYPYFERYCQENNASFHIYIIDEFRKKLKQLSTQEVFQMLNKQPEDKLSMSVVCVPTIADLVGMGDEEVFKQNVQSMSDFTDYCKKYYYPVVNNFTKKYAKEIKEFNDKVNKLYPSPEDADVFLIKPTCLIGVRIQGINTSKQYKGFNIPSYIDKVMYFENDKLEKTPYDKFRCTLINNLFIKMARAAQIQNEGKNNDVDKVINEEILRILRSI